MAKTEEASGAVVYQIVDGAPAYLLLKSEDSGFWGFPKGHVEAGESLVATAIREIREETGLIATPNTDFKHELNYDMKNGNHKVVTLFTTEVAEGSVVVRQKKEIANVAWLPFVEARDRLTYDNLKEMLDAANDYILDRMANQHD